MIAGGGASVIYTDTIVDLCFKDELANYGEYSGNPTTDETYQYAKTILDLITREKDLRGKVLIIGGGIANFTDVAKTFTGIIKALKEYKQKIIENKVRIYVRRGGPNYQEGLKKMRELGENLGVPIKVFGPEAHMTSIVPMAINALEG
jgi:succinyl-CoA synthetase beta subunit